MGLDSVELLEEIEKTFDIRIPDPVAEKMDTVGKAYDEVWKRIQHRNSGKCILQVLFYRLRACFKEELPAGINISPCTLIDDIVPKADRRKIWATLALRSKLKVPELVLPDKIARGLFKWGLVVFCSISWLSWYLNERLQIGGLIYLLAIAVCIVIIRLSSGVLKPQRVAIPCTTMRELTLQVLAMNMPALNGQGVTRKEMEMIINNVIVEKMGIDPDEIAPGKFFGNDLGLN